MPRRLKVVAQSTEGPDTVEGEYNTVSNFVLQIYPCYQALNDAHKYIFVSK